MYSAVKFHRVPEMEVALCAVTSSGTAGTLYTTHHRGGPVHPCTGRCSLHLCPAKGAEGEEVGSLAGPDGEDG